MSSSERIKELKFDSTLWSDPKRIINLVDFDSNLIHQTQDLKIL